MVALRAPLWDSRPKLGRRRSGAGAQGRRRRYDLPRWRLEMVARTLCIKGGRSAEYFFCNSRRNTPRPVREYGRRRRGSAADRASPQPNQNDRRERELTRIASENWNLPKTATTAKGRGGFRNPPYESQFTLATNSAIITTRQSTSGRSFLEVEEGQEVAKGSERRRRRILD